MSHKDEAPVRTYESGKAAITVILCSYNGGARIANSLQALISQSELSQMRIIVIDDGSTDNTAQIVQSYVDSFPKQMQLISLTKNSGISAARNAGVAKATTPLIAFTDDDCLPDSKWIKKLLSRWTAAPSSTVGLGGPVRAADTNTFNRRFLDLDTPLHPVEHRAPTTLLARLAAYLRPAKANLPALRPVDSFVGANMSFRASAVKQVGGFDDAIRFGGDEQYLCAKLREVFGESSLVLDEDIKMSHQFHRSFKDTLRRAAAYGQGNGRNWSNRSAKASFLPGPLITSLLSLLCLVVVNHIAGFNKALLATLATALLSTYLLGARYLKSAPTILDKLTFPLAHALTEIADNYGFIKGSLLTPVESESAPADKAPQLLVAQGGSKLFPLASLEIVAALTIFKINPLTSAFALISTTLLIGSALASLLGYTPKSRAIRFLTAAALGITALSLLSLALSGIGALTDTKLLNSPAAVIAPLALLRLLTAPLLIKDKDPLRYLLGGLQLREAYAFAALLLLPSLAALGAWRLNVFGSGAMSYIVAALSLLLLILAVSWRKVTTLLPAPLVVFTLSLAASWSYSLRGAGLYGWDIQKEYQSAAVTIARGWFTFHTKGDAYASMLSLTSLPALMHGQSGIAAEALLRWLYPLALAVTAAGIVAAAAKRGSSRAALLTFSVIDLATSTWAGQMAALARQELAFCLFAALIVAVLATDASVKSRRVVAILAGSTLAFTHYTTSYISVTILVFAGLIFLFSPSRKLSKPLRVLTLPVIVTILASTLLWNGVITRPGTEIGSAVSTVSKNGVQVLNNHQKSLLARWLLGTGTQVVPYSEYKIALDQHKALLPWLITDPRGSKVVITDAHLPTVKTPLSSITPLWNALNVIGNQLLNLIIVITVLTYLISYIRRRKLPSPANEPTASSVANQELLGAATGALFISALLRLSSSLGTLYNPERAALHTGLIFTLLLTPLFSRRLGNLIKPYLAIAVTSSLALSVLVLGGDPSASHSNTGEDAQRFVISAPELASINFLAKNLPAKALLQTDRYGSVQLVTVENGKNFTVTDIVDPTSVDTRAFVYMTKTNTIDGVGRASQNGVLAIFHYPASFFEDTRPLLYSTEDTHVFG